MGFGPVLDLWFRLGIGVKFRVRVRLRVYG